MFVVIHYVTYVGIAAHAAFIGFFAWLHLPSLAIFNVFSVAAWVVARVANQRQHRSLAAGLIATEVLCHAILAVALLGWDSGFHYYLIPVIPFLLFDDDLPTRLVVAGSTVVSALYVALHAWARPRPSRCRPGFLSATSWCPFWRWASSASTSAPPHSTPSSAWRSWR
jgi:hypothetical protein